MKFAEQDPGPTGEWSPAKVAGGVIGAMAIVPLLSYFGVLIPRQIQDWRVAVAFTAVLLVISAGAWAGLGKGLFRRLGQAAVDRIGSKGGA